MICILPLAFGACARVEFEPDGGPVAQVDIYSDEHTARAGKRGGLLGEDVWEELAETQRHMILLAVSHYEGRVRRAERDLQRSIVQAARKGAI
jgi:hypothetical protein